MIETAGPSSMEGLMTGGGAGDHNLDSRRAAGAISMLNTNKAVSRLSADLTAYVNEFGTGLDERQAINVWRMKVVKDQAVYDPILGKEVIGDTLASLDGALMEDVTDPFEKDGLVWQTVHRVAQAVAGLPDRGVVIWASPGLETVETVGTNNRIYRAEKNGDEVFMVAYTVGGSETELRLTMENISGKPVRRDKPLLTCIEIFEANDPRITHEGIFQAYTKGLSLPNKTRLQTEVNRFAGELKFSDETRLKAVEERQRQFREKMYQEIAKEKDVITAFSTIAQTIAGSVGKIDRQKEIKHSEEVLWLSGDSIRIDSSSPTIPVWHNHLVRTIAPEPIRAVQEERKPAERKEVFRKLKKYIIDGLAIVFPPKNIVIQPIPVMDEKRKASEKRNGMIEAVREEEQEAVVMLLREKLVDLLTGISDGFHDQTLEPDHFGPDKKLPVLETLFKSSTATKISRKANAAVFLIKSDLPEVSFTELFHPLAGKGKSQTSRGSEIFDTFDGAPSIDSGSRVKSRDKLCSLGQRKQAPFSINNEHTPAFMPESRRIDLKTIFRISEVIQRLKPEEMIALYTEVFIDKETSEVFKKIVFALLFWEMERLSIDSKLWSVISAEQFKALSGDNKLVQKDLIAKIRLIFKDYIPSFDLTAFEDRFILDNIIVLFVILVISQYQSRYESGWYGMFTPPGHWEALQMLVRGAPYFQIKDNAAYSIEKIVSPLNLQKRYYGKRKPGKVLKKLPQKQVLFDYRTVKFCRLLVNYGHNVTQ